MPDCLTKSSDGTPLHQHACMLQWRIDGWSSCNFRGPFTGPLNPLKIDVSRGPPGLSGGPGPLGITVIRPLGAMGSYNTADITANHIRGQLPTSWNSLTVSYMVQWLAVDVAHRVLWYHRCRYYTFTKCKLSQIKITFRHAIRSVKYISEFIT